MQSSFGAYPLDAAGAGLAGEALRARLSPIVRGWAQYFDTPLPDGAALGTHGVIAPPASGVRVERLPGPDAAPELHAQPMTLPLGVHLETGARSRLRWGNGIEVGPELDELFSGQANDPALLSRAVPAAAPAAATARERAPAVDGVPTELGQAVERVMKGCALLRHLADKAAAVGHLDHAERLSVLYSLGHLGPQGERAIHTLIGRCRNYDAAETSRQIPTAERESACW